jgi:hypothetical protein
MNALDGRPKIVRSMIWLALVPTFVVPACAPSVVSYSAPGQTQTHAPSSRAPSERFPLETGASPVSLGLLRPGQSATGNIPLNNPGRDTITVEHVDTSCRCLEIGPVPAAVRARQTQQLTVRFNPSEEPNFRGKLSIEVTGRAPDGAVVFRTRVQLEIEDGR